MTNGPLAKKMLKFAIPLMLSGLLQLLFNAADIVVCGRFAGDEALAAVGAATSPVHLVTTLLIGLSSGVNVTVAKAVGSGRTKDIHESIHTSMLLAIICGFFVGAVGLMTSGMLLSLIGTPEEILPLSEVYMNILFAGVPAMAIYNFGSGIFRARGDTRRPLYYLLFAGVLNVALNLFFVIVLHMSVAGVALATALSQVISMLLIVITLMKEKEPYRLEFRKLRLYRAKVKSIVMIGIPAGIQGMLFSASNMVIQSAINSYGKIVIAGSSAASSLEGFTFISMDAFSQTALSFTSQNIGAGKIERVRYVLRTSIIMVSLAGLILGCTTYIFGRPLLGIYTKNPAVVEAGMVRLLYICVPYFLCGIQNVLPSTTRGMGYSVVPMIITVLGVCGLRVVWITTVCQLPSCSSVEWVYASYAVTWSITSISHYIYYRIVYRKESQKYISSAASA